MHNNKIVTSSENPGRPVREHPTGSQIRGSLRHPWRLGKGPRHTLSTALPLSQVFHFTLLQAPWHKTYLSIFDPGE